MKTLDIGIDLDGVMYDFAGSVRNYLVEKHDFDAAGLPDPECWDFFITQWGFTADTFRDYVNQGVDEGSIFRWGQVPNAAWQVMHALHNMGHRTHIVTARDYGSPGAAEEATKYWLRNNNIRHTSLTFSQDKTAVPVDVFVDDNVDNYLALEAAGHNPWLYNRPWNQHLEGAQRVYGWNQFMDVIIDLSFYSE